MKKSELEVKKQWLMPLNVTMISGYKVFNFKFKMAAKIIWIMNDLGLKLGGSFENRRCR